MTLPNAVFTAAARTESLSSISSIANATTSVRRINSGGGSTGDWGADAGYSSSNVAVVTTAINTSKVSNPAPTAVYQSQRWAPNFTYTLTNFPANGAETVRLHFVESVFSAARKRQFNVTINGSRVLSNFDIFASAGGKNIAVSEQFSTHADAAGRLTIQFIGTIQDPSIAAIEVTGAQAALPLLLAINSGGSATGSWAADEYYSGGAAEGASDSINTSHVTDPAPQIVYQRQRFGTSFSYNIPHLTPGAAYTVLIHFAETYFTVPGQRIFNVSINGTRVLSNFDIVESAGGENLAIVKQFNTTADSSGKIGIEFASIYNGATVAGIEILDGASAPTPAPAPTSLVSAPSERTSGFGPRVAVGPQASITCPPNSVHVSAGSSIQNAVNSNPAGKSFCLAAGTFSEQQIVPKSGDTFVGVKGAILDGRNATTYAFTGDATNVTIENLTVENYRNPSQSAAINPQRNGNGWVINNNEVANNAAAGIGAQSWEKVIANYIHDNAQEGYTINGDNVVFTDNEIAHNNPNDAFSNTFESGGGKASGTKNLVVSYNYSHDNHGAGLWTDMDSQGTTYEYNDLMNNWGAGISHEVSWDAKIDHNYLKYNANIAYCGGNKILTFSCDEIRISDSGGEPGTTIDISNNTVIPNSLNAAIGLANTNKGNGLYGRWRIQNVRVHNNTVNLSAGGVIGLVDEDDSDTPAIFHTGNSFDYDAFTGADSSAFYWEGDKESFSALQRQGQEAHGSSH